jgi:hypothetical protein
MGKELPRELLLTVARAASKLVLQESAARCLHTSRERLRLHAASWIYRRHALTNLFCPILFYPATIPHYQNNLTLSAIPISLLKQFPSTPPLRTHPHGQQQYEASPLHSVKSQYCTKHASRYRQHGCRRVMIGSVCRTTPTTQAPLRRPMRQPLPSHAPKASPRLYRTTAITTTSSKHLLTPAIPRHSLEPG